MLRQLSIILLIELTVNCHPYTFDEWPETKAKCGYPSCPQPIPGKLNVHLVPHSHDDVGWLKTVDQYYYGSKTNIQNAGVQYILDSVVRELSEDPNKKFIYVETAFFWKWWMEQKDHMRHKVKKLVANGQLEFIGGAWSMNDEATTHYQSVIDQFTWGFRKLNDTFGYCGQPKIGWQIDPFGHSRETASMMAQMGFDGLFFGRLDYQDKRARLLNKTMEMIWEGSPSLGPEADLLTGALYNFYSAPEGFCFDILCDDDPIIDDQESPEYNVHTYVKRFKQFADKQSQYFRTNNIIMTFGMDFNYQYAHKNFKNMDKLIRYVNERQKNGSNINVFYSTPSCYIKSLNEANIYWPTKTDDFFPYASDPHAYWTGYFTSRPTLKYYERLGNNYLQICKQLTSVTHLGSQATSRLNALREAMGIMQHHDAVTGTEKQHVANDYARILSSAFDKCGQLINEAMNRLTNSDPMEMKFESCHLRNISECSISTDSHKFIVTVYNPLSRPVDHYVRVPVVQSHYSVRDPTGKNVEYQIIPIPAPVASIPGRKSKSDKELVFKAKSVPALGFISYFISASDEPTDLVDDVSGGIPNENSFDDSKNESSKRQLNINGSVVTFSLNDSMHISMRASVHYYIGQVGNNMKPENRSSGAYIFRPDGVTPIELKNTGKDTVHKGKIVTEYHQTFSSWASHVVREYADESFLEVEWMVGPIPVSDGKGKEVVWRYTTSIHNNETFFTDSNGRENIERIKNYRPTWDVSLKEPVAGNYYPITTDISINEGHAFEVTVITDRAQGGTSLNDGQIELMVHRRLLHDDAFGVNEALNETAFGTGLVARGRHWIMLGEMSNHTWHQQKRLLKQEKVLDSLVILTNADSIEFDNWSQNYTTQFTGLTKSLPSAIQILTLEPWGPSSFLLRLEHLFDKNESQEEVTVDLNNLFITFDIVSVRETTLGANQWLDEAERFKWKKETNEVNVEEECELRDDGMKITMKPKQIRTFVCKIKPKVFL